MRQFTYARPAAEPEALSLAAQPGSSVIAGGTELLNWMRLGVAAPEHVVDIGRLPGRGKIAVNGETLFLGALCTLNQVGEHPLVQAHAQALAQACLAAASPQLRNRATLGGNVLQRTRCPYFRTEEPLPSGCNKRLRGTGCSALRGVSDEQAIFGWTEACVATHPSDPLVALTCLDAEVELASADGARTMSLCHLHTTQDEAEQSGQDPAQSETTLRPEELITGFRIPVQSGARSSYVKVRERQSYAFALVAAAAAISLQGDVIVAARIVLGSVAQRPWRLRGAEAALVGHAADEDRVSDAIGEDLREARPLPGNAYKVRLARNAAVRAVMMVAS
jgi:xanthine dehydrogenase YagS FAD-binding subunit